MSQDHLRAGLSSGSELGEAHAGVFTMLPLRSVSSKPTIERLSSRYTHEAAYQYDFHECEQDTNGYPPPGGAALHATSSPSMSIGAATPIPPGSDPPARETSPETPPPPCAGGVAVRSVRLFSHPGAERASSGVTGPATSMGVGYRTASHGVAKAQSVRRRGPIDRAGGGAGGRRVCRSRRSSREPYDLQPSD